MEAVFCSKSEVPLGEWYGTVRHGADPGQTTNIADLHPEIVAAMRTAYADWWKVTRTMMVNESAPMSPVQPFAVAFEKQRAAIGIPDWSAPVFEE